MVSVHTSPLDQPGTGDAGGMNVYVVELSRRLAAHGVEVDLITRATSSDLPPSVDLGDGRTVRHVTAGPFEGLAKEDLPAQLCAFTSGLMRLEASRPPGWYDLVHSHYWLSGQVAWLAAERWDVPLIHSMHTMAKVKNLALAEDDAPEPMARAIGEAQVVEAADRLVANTGEEADQLVDLYDADPDRIAVIPPGVDLDLFSPCSRTAARRRLGVPDDAFLLLFVGRIQPLKAPDVLLRAVARLQADGPLQVAIVGGPSGSGLATPAWLTDLARDLDLGGTVRFVPPSDRDTVVAYYRAADATVVPSYTESFGLVALESQACGTPVIAAAVGGLTTAVADGVSGLLVDGHDPEQWAKVIGELLRSPAELAHLTAHARGHAEKFSWDRTTDDLLSAYYEAAAEMVGR
jgi:D-inositol-3-phosphate glycosyltransferase